MAIPPTTPYVNNGQGGTLINPYLPTSQASFVFWRKPVFTASDGTLWSPGFEGPTYSANPWDFVYLGIPSTEPFTPGICRVTVDNSRDVDKKKAAGSDGARVTIHGKEPAKVDIEIIIWTPEQLKALAGLWPVLFPPAYKKSPPAYDAQHPVLSIHGIKSLQFIGGSGPDIDGQGRGSFKMKALEFLKPGKKNAAKTESGSIGSLLDPGAYPTPGQSPVNLGPL